MTQEANIYRHMGIHTEVQHRHTQTRRETYTYNTNTQAHTEVYTHMLTQDVHTYTYILTIAQATILPSMAALAVKLVWRNWELAHS